MSALHTPGPWAVTYGADERQGMVVPTDIRIRAGHPEFGLLVALLHNPGNAESEANACLISAAPELFAASRKAWETLVPWIDDDEVFAAISQLSAAIARATGAA